MKLHTSFAVLLACIGLTAQAQSVHGDKVNFSLQALLNKPEVQKAFDPAIKFYWENAQTPEVAEKTAELISRSRRPISNASYFDDYCVAAFASTIKNATEEAKLNGFDMIINAKSSPSGRKPAALPPSTIECTNNYFAAETPLKIVFAASPEANKRYLDAEKAAQAAVPQNRPAAKNAIYLPLAPILNSPQAKEILEDDEDAPKKIYAGLQNAPAYTERFIPMHYSDDDAKISKYGQEGACKRAVLNVLKSIIKDMEERKDRYNAIIKVRSYLNDQFAPVDTDLECDVGSKEAKVKLIATFATVE